MSLHTFITSPWGELCAKKNAMKFFMMVAIHDLRVMCGHFMKNFFMYIYIDWQGFYDI